MDGTIKYALAGLFLLFVIVAGTFFLQPPLESGQDSGVQVPIPTLPAPSETENVPPDLTNGIQARIDDVDTDQLALGNTSYAYVTLTNTGTITITNTRIEITVARDFGFPLGYQERFFFQEFSEHIEPGTTRTLTGEFKLPLYDGPVLLEGMYTATVRVYANDRYYIGDWNGEIFLGR